MRLLVLFLSCVSVLSCTITPEKINPNDLTKFGNSSVKQFYNLQRAPTHRLDIYEVSARVLKYNINRRLKQMESDLSLAKFKQYKHNLLPNFDLQSSYRKRSNDELKDSYSVSRDEYTVADSISEERSGRDDKLEISWNVLDFGVGYLSAKQQGDAVLMAKESRRKAIFNLLERAYTAYWFAVAAEKYEKLALNLNVDIDKALKKLSSSVLADALPEESLARQRNLLRDKRTVNSSLRVIRENKTELADLMGLPANTKFKVYAHKELLPVINLSSNQIDQNLFANHPDMRIAAYKEKIGLAETKIAFYKLFPRLSLNVGYSNQTDKFLVHKTYNYIGASAAWNLFNIIHLSDQRKQAVIERKFTKSVRLANGVAVLTASRIKELLYRNALERYADDVHLHMVEKQLSKTMRSMQDIDVVSYIDVVEAGVSELRSGLERVESYAQLMRYALSISSVLSANDFNYDLNTTPLATLKYNLQRELSMMPISWVGSSGSKRINVPNQFVKKDVQRVQKLWRQERSNGVAEKGDNLFNPNVLPVRSPVIQKAPTLKQYRAKPLYQHKKVASQRKPVVGRKASVIKNNSLGL